MAAPSSGSRQPITNLTDRKNHVSLFDVARRSVHRVLGSGGETAAPAVPERGSEPRLINGMPEGVPAAALRPEPPLPVPAGWPFGEHFPRTCGTGRLAAGALFWTDFLYDDSGAAGRRVSMPVGRVVPPAGTYVYPSGPAARNGADIFRVAIGLTKSHTWWRVDWNTLLDPSVPIAMFTFGTGRHTHSDWPARAGIRSAGIDTALLISGTTAQLIDLTSQTATSVPYSVDMDSRSFLARIPRAIVEPSGTWTVRLAAGLANDSGDGFAVVPADRGARPGQGNVYNVAFRTCEQESAHHNFWSDRAQAHALARADVSEFSVSVRWQELDSAVVTDEPRVVGTSTRWYVSSIELGQGLADSGLLATEPHFLGRVQPYSVCVPESPAERARPVTLLLHSITMGQNQFAAIDGRLLRQLCDDRDSVVVSPLGRGPACWYLDEGELDVWEVWARVAEDLGTDPDRTVIAGYSMGGYGAYRLGLTYPSVFSQAVVLAGAPRCGIRVLPALGLPADIDHSSHCAREGETWPLLRNARWLPFVISHGALDEFVPVTSVAQQVLRLDRLGYRYRVAIYPTEDHVALAIQGKFDDSVSHMLTALRPADPGRISFSWYPQLDRLDLGLGPQRIWWLSDLRACAGVAQRRGAVATVEAQSLARPDTPHRTRRRGGFFLGSKPAPGFYAEQTWERQTDDPDVEPVVTLDLQGVAGLTVDVNRAGLADGWPEAAIRVTTDSHTEITLKTSGPALVFAVTKPYPTPR